MGWGANLSADLYADFLPNARESGRARGGIAGRQRRRRGGFVLYEVNA
jgi:hypothetical protein